MWSLPNTHCTPWQRKWQQNTIAVHCWISYSHFEWISHCCGIQCVFRTLSIMFKRWLSSINGQKENEPFDSGGTSIKICGGIFFWWGAKSIECSWNSQIWSNFNTFEIIWGEKWGGGRQENIWVCQGLMSPVVLPLISIFERCHLVQESK